MIVVRTYDRWLLFATLALVALGTLMVYSSTSVITPVLERKHVTEFYYLKKHLCTLVISLVAMWVAYIISQDMLKKMVI